MSRIPQDEQPQRSQESLQESEERFRLLVESVADYAIFMLDPQGQIVSWNKGAEKIKGYRAEEIIGRHFSVFYPQEQIDRGFPAYELTVARAEGRFEDEGWRIRKDGTRFWANVVITALREPNGELYGFAKVTRDMTERRAQEEELRQSEERFRLMIEGVKDYAIFMLDPKGYVASWNSGAERIKGYKAHEIIGKHFSTFYPREPVERGFPEFELREAARVGRFEDEGWRIRKDGSRFWANVVITALFDDDGKLYGYAKVTRDMTERKRVEALELAERRMIEFLAMLSHELRNPLAPISNAVYMLQLNPTQDPETRWAREVIERQVSLLSRLVDDLLEVSRVTSGGIRLQRETVDLASILTRAVESSRPLVEARHHSFAVQAPSSPVPVDGDPARLSQVMINLLNNAAKYTSDGGHVGISVAREGEEGVIRVWDDGPGISEEFMPKIFDLFSQGERTLDRSEGGLGIGLTLVRRLVEMHGGSVEVANRDEGGSVFTVRLPLVATEAGSSAEQEEPEEHYEGESVRVLVVDDNIDASTSMMLFMRRWGYQVRTAHDGVAALEAAREFRPDIILLDIGLPRLDGYEVARALRDEEATATTTIIAVTGYGQDEDRRRAREAGFDHHFVKPVEPMKLRELLEAIAAERRSSS